MAALFTEGAMPLTQILMLTAIVALFTAMPLILLYGWIVTKGWEQTPSALVKAPSISRPQSPAVSPDAGLALSR